MIVVVAVALLLYARIYYGIDLTDECQQVHNAVGAFWNAQPFATELTFTQTGSLLFTPLAWLYIQIFPELDYVVLFFRHLYFLLAVGSACLMYCEWRKFLPPVAAGFTATLPLMMIPLAIPSVSYNTLAYFLGAVGFHLLLGRRGICGAGLTHGIAAYAHPGYYPVVALTSVQLWRERGLRSALKYLTTSMALVLFLFGLLMLAFGQERLLGSWVYQFGNNYGGVSDKLSSMAGEFLQYMQRPWLVAIWAVLWAGLSWMGHLHWPLAVLSLILTQNYLLNFDFVYDLHLRVGTYTAGLVWLVLWDRSSRRDPDSMILQRWIFWPGIGSGLMMGFVSLNGMATASFGLLLTLLYALYKLLQPRTWWGRVVAGALFVQFAFSTMNLIQRDDRVQDLTAYIGAGPFAGLHTSPFRAQWLATMASTLRVLEPQGQTVFFHDMFPAGYLMTKLAPSGPLTMPVFNTWAPGQRRLLVHHFRTAEAVPDFVVEFQMYAPTAKKIYRVKGADSLNGPDDPFAEFFAKSGRYDEWVDYKLFRVLKKRPKEN